MQHFIYSMEAFTKKKPVWTRTTALVTLTSHTREITPEGAFHPEGNVCPQRKLVSSSS